MIELKEENNLDLNSLLEIEYDIFSDDKINEYKKINLYYSLSRTKRNTI